MRGWRPVPIVGPVRKARLVALPAICLVFALSPALSQAGNIGNVGVAGAEAVRDAWSRECFGVYPRGESSHETVAQVGPLESGYEILDDGLLKSWTVLGYTQSKANNPPQNPPDGFVRFDLFRSFGSSRPTKVAESLPAAYLDGKTANGVSMPVQAGDGIGVDLEANPANEESEAYAGCGFFVSSNNGEPFIAIWSPPLVSNSPTPESNIAPLYPRYGLSLGAEIEYDAPQITGISQSSGAVAGGDKVTITGNHIAHVAVHFGTEGAGEYETTNSQVVVRVPPAEKEGAVDLTLKTAGGTATLAGGYTYGAGGSSEPEPEKKPSPTPGPTPGPIPSPGPTPAPGPLKFKLPRPKVAASGAISLHPSAPAPGSFHAEAVVVETAKSSRASTSRSIVYGTAVAHASKKGPVTLKISPSAAAKALLEKEGQLKVHLTVTFTPKAGTPSSHSTSAVVHG